MTDKKPTAMQRLLEARGEEIKQERERQGLSQAQLAEAAGTTQQTVDRIERGVTANSKAFPKIRAVLGLKPWPGLPIDETSAPLPENREELAKLDHFFRETERYLSVEDGTHIPIFAMSSEGLLIRRRFADAIPRGYPVQNVKNAYGLISRDYQMQPIVRVGDIVIVNPNIPPTPLSEVVFSREVGNDVHVLIRSLGTENEFSWTISNGEGETDVLSKEEWTTAELIVAKISRVR